MLEGINYQYDEAQVDQGEDDEDICGFTGNGGVDGEAHGEEET